MVTRPVNSLTCGRSMVTGTWSISRIRTWSQLSMARMMNPWPLFAQNHGRLQGMFVVWQTLVFFRVYKVDVKFYCSRTLPEPLNIASALISSIMSSIYNAMMTLLLYMKCGMIYQTKDNPNNDTMIHLRHNEKVTLECELAELRRVRNSEWEKTKHHLKLAKSKTSLHLQESFERPDPVHTRDGLGLGQVSSVQPVSKQGSFVWDNKY